MALLFLVAMPSHAANQPEYYSRWSNLPSTKLLEMGHEYAEIVGKPDSALVCYTIVGSRYNDNLDVNAKEQCLKAFIGRWFVYFFSYFDYSKSYESLSKAEEISREIDRMHPRVLLNFGVMYQTISEQSGDMKLRREAYNYYRQAVESSLNEADSNTLAMAMGNLITVSSSLGVLPRIKPFLDKYIVYLRKQHVSLPDYNELLYRGMLQLNDKQYVAALQTFEFQNSKLAEENSFLRYHYVSIYNQAMALCGLKRYDDAIRKMKILEEMAIRTNMKDARLEVFRTLSDIYKKKGDIALSQDYNSKYLQVKDTLLNYQQLAGVNELHFLNEMKKVDEQITEMNHQRHVHDMALVAITFIAIVVIVFLLIVYRKNRKLRSLNESLYQKTVDMLNEEELARQRKYSSSGLADADKQALYDEICKVMETNSRIFSLDFSVDTLASIVGSNSKYVSQVINQMANVNFSSFVNEYRIKEACKRLNDIEHYGILTIEAVANSVGFRSRSSFVAAFKKFTGLTPSEYQRIAKGR